MLCIHSRTINAKPKKGFQLVSGAHLFLEKPREMTIIRQYDEQNQVDSEGKMDRRWQCGWGKVCSHWGCVRTKPSGDSFAGQPSKQVDQVTSWQQLHPFSYREGHISSFKRKKKLQQVLYEQNQTKNTGKQRRENQSNCHHAGTCGFLFQDSSRKAFGIFFTELEPSDLPVPQVSVAADPQNPAAASSDHQGA